MSSHELLFQRLASELANEGRQLLVVTLHPAPVAQLREDIQWPPFHDIAARLYFQRKCGVSTLATVSLSKKELDQHGVSFFLSNLCKSAKVSELLLGAGQSLGRTGKGDQRSILSFCSEHNISVRYLPQENLNPTVMMARTYIQKGELKRAVEIVDRPLFWHRPQSKYLNLPWPSGKYLAILLSEPSNVEVQDAHTLEVYFEPSKYGSKLLWPNKTIQWLGFINGPADREL